KKNVTPRDVEGVDFGDVYDMKLKSQTGRRQMSGQSGADVIEVSQGFFVANQANLAGHPLNRQLAENHFLFGRKQIGGLGVRDYFRRRTLLGAAEGTKDG